MNIYLIEADYFWPVGNAGAIVVASTEIDATNLIKEELKNPHPPKLIGKALYEYNEPKIIFINTTNY